MTAKDRLRKFCQKRDGSLHRRSNCLNSWRHISQEIICKLPPITLQFMWMAREHTTSSAETEKQISFFRHEKCTSGRCSSSRIPILGASSALSVALEPTFAHWHMSLDR